jgi:hypothetical protein
MKGLPLFGIQPVNCLSLTNKASNNSENFNGGSFKGDNDERSVERFFY